MVERTQLGERILRHWQENCPQMVKELERENRLDRAVSEAQEWTGDLLYELVSVKKMDYHAAWEVAMREWAFLPEESGTVGSKRRSRKKAASGKWKSSKTGARARRPRRGTSE